MKHTYELYLIKDSHENEAIAVVEDASDTIQICGMHDKENKYIHFESEAYHLGSAFNEENGCTVTKITKTIDFDEELKNAK